eukprot:2312734-Amphidinium_carterae.1
MRRAVPKGSERKLMDYKQPFRLGGSCVHHHRPGTRSGVTHDHQSRTLEAILDGLLARYKDCCLLYTSPSPRDRG